MKLLIILASFFLASCTQDQQNKIFRKSIELLDGDYMVTFSNGPISKTWRVKNGKVTTSEKGYYYFWDDKKHYVQVPIEHTVVEEID